MAAAFDSYQVTTTTAAGSPSVSVPAGTVDDDMLLGVICQNSDGSSAPNIPADFVDEQFGAGAASEAAGDLDYRVASSEPASYTFSVGDESVSIIGRITGADTTDPTDVSNVSSGSGTAPSCPSVTTTVDDCLVLYVLCTRHGNTNHFISGPSATTQEVAEERDAGGPTLYVYSKTQASAGATGSGDFSFSATRGYTAFTVAIAPSAGGGISVPVVMAHRRSQGMS